MNFFEKTDVRGTCRESSCCVVQPLA